MLMGIQAHPRPGPPPLRRRRAPWREEWEHVGACSQVVSPIRHGVLVKLENVLRHKLFNHGVSMMDTTKPQLNFLETELPQFEACGAWQRVYNIRFVSSPMFLVPKPSVNK
jgi:hypothetical protein